MPLHVLWPHIIHCEHWMDLLPTPLRRQHRGTCQISGGLAITMQRPGTCSSSCWHRALYFPWPFTPWAWRYTPFGCPRWAPGHQRRGTTMVHQCLNSRDSASSTRMKSSGQRTEPWCTPTPTPNSPLYWTLTCTWLQALEYMPWMTRTAHSSTPRLLRSHNRIFLRIWTKAFSRSTSAK